MKKAKEYSNKYYHSWIDNGGDNSHYVMHSSEFNKAIEIAYLEGQLKVIRDSEMCNAGEREIQHRLKQLLDD